MSKEKIEQLVHDQQDRLALAELRLLVEQDVSLANTHFGLKILEQVMALGRMDLKTVRVGVLSTFTIEPLLPHLRLAAGLNLMDVQPYSGDFNQVEQEAMNPQSGLYACNPEVVILAIRGEEFASDLWGRFATLRAENRVEEAVQHALGRIRALLEVMRTHTRASIAVHNYVPPAHPALGLIDTLSADGQVAVVHRFNALLAELAASMEGVYVVDYARLVAERGFSAWHDQRMWHLARQPLSALALPLLAQEYVAVLRALNGMSRKCLVLDCDNTLWGGVIGEDGMSGIQIGHDYPGSAFRTFQEVVLRLHDRGVILAVNSKNNKADVLEVFDQHPDMLLKREHLAAMQVNWINKADNMQALAADLNIGLDHMVFLDDNPVERQLVREQLPQVLVPELPEDPVEFTETLLRIRDFDALSWSVEDRTRTQMYRQEVDRHQFMQATGNLESFYRGLEMRMVVGQADETSLPRIAQLTQRTNQFNLTTKRYTELDLTRFMKSHDKHVFWLRLTDRFGDNGIVGAAIIREVGSTWDIDSLLMSCRVLGRTVEDAFLAFLVAEARTAGAGKIKGRYEPTAKNSQVADFYSSRGFCAGPKDEEGCCWILEVADAGHTIPNWISLEVDGVPDNSGLVK